MNVLTVNSNLTQTNEASSKSVFLTGPTEILDNLRRIFRAVTSPERSRVTASPGPTPPTPPLNFRRRWSCWWCHQTSTTPLHHRFDPIENHMEAQVLRPPVSVSGFLVTKRHDSLSQLAPIINPWANNQQSWPSSARFTCLTLIQRC